MATTDVKPKFQNHDFRPVSQSPDFRPQLTASSPAHDGLKFWQYMISGSIAGSIEHMAMFPVDTVKTQMQHLGSCPIKSVSVREALKSIFKSDGPIGLYRGIGAMGLGAAPAHAAYFSIYEFAKKYLSGGKPENTFHLIGAASFATIAHDSVMTPMDMVKQRMQLSSSPYKKGVLDCIRRVLKEEGFKAFYASYRTTVLMSAPFHAVHFLTYEEAKKALLEISPENASEDKWIVHATAGALAGGSAALLTTPLDVVKTQLQCQGVCGCDRFKSDSIADVTRTIVKKDGLRGMWRGWAPRMLFHAPAAAISWSVYEAAKSFFQEMNGNQDS